MHARSSVSVAAVLLGAAFVSILSATGRSASVDPTASPLTSSTAAPVQGSSGYHEDKLFGFKFKPPKDWSNIPVKVDEGWLVAKFLSKRDYHYTEKGGWTYEHKPELMAIAFVDDSIKEKKDDVEVEEKGGDVIITFNNKYEDYEDYLKKTYHGGGYYVADEEKIENNDVSITALDIKVEKLTRTGPKRIRTWIYHLEGVDIAIQIEVLENHYKKLKKTVDGILKSFDEIPREGTLPTEQTSGDGFVFLSRSQLDELSLSERNKRLMEQCEAQHQRVIDALPDDWDHKEEKGCLVISNADLKYGKDLANHANAVMKWLEDNFDFIGPQRYVRGPILRICKSRDEEYAYERGGGNGWGGTSLEFVTSLENIRDWAGEFNWITGRVATHWFQDRDRELYLAMPEWLRHGVTEFLENSKAKGSKLKFRVDDWERDDLREAVREGRVRGARSLMQMSRTELWSTDGQDFFSARNEAENFVFFLLAGDGSKNKKYKEIIPNYLKNLKLVLEETKDLEEEKVPGAADAPETEEEEEERFRKLQENYKDREKEFLEKVFDRTFADWSQKDWDKLEKAFTKSIS